MSRKQRGSKPQIQTIQVWDFDQTTAALPYLTSVMRSVREHRLEAQQHQLAARRLAGRPGRPNRAAILAHEEETRRAREANERFQEAVEELQVLDVYCVDPVGGQALIPFLQGDQLAWFIYDLFDPQHVSFWRYHTDPLDTRRPLAEVLNDHPGAGLAV